MFNSIQFNSIQKRLKRKLKQIATQVNVLEVRERERDSLNDEVQKTKRSNTFTVIATKKKKQTNKRKEQGLDIILIAFDTK